MVSLKYQVQLLLNWGLKIEKALLFLLKILYSTGSFIIDMTTQAFIDI